MERWESISLNEASRVMCTTVLTFFVLLVATCFSVADLPATVFFAFEAAVLAGAFTVRAWALALAMTALTAPAGAVDLTVLVAVLVAMMDFFPEC
jgi:hypothetical protein